LSWRLSRPPLSYSLPAFDPSGYERVHRSIDNLRALGFRWVTLHPTWLVHDETPPRIRPVSPDVAGAIAYAREAGLFLQLDPHLDYESTLSGGPYKWRRSMRVDPGGEYFDVVLAPMAALRPDRLTLGSELDHSLYEFGREWSLVPPRIDLPLLGHKLNHDVFTRETSIFLASYLSQLDYAAFSFYPSIEFDDAAGDLVRNLRRFTPTADFAIGEFGLGCTDVTKPWYFDSTAFRTAADFDLRRDYYLRFLEWLSFQSYTTAPVTFWSAGHYDFLGILEQPGLEAFRDDALREAVSEYNQHQ
jgi:hypothetical protein